MLTVTIDYEEIKSLNRQLENVKLSNRLMKEILDDIAKLVGVEEDGDKLIARVALIVMMLRRIKLECRGHAEILANETLETLFPNS